MRVRCVCGLGWHGARERGSGQWSETEHAKASAWTQPATARRERGRGAAIGCAGERERENVPEAQRDGLPARLEGAKQ